jgi:hypothetical protein
LFEDWEIIKKEGVGYAMDTVKPSKKDSKKQGEDGQERWTEGWKA